MKLHYRTPNNRLTFEISGDNIKEIISELSDISDVFGAGSICGACNSGNTTMQSRTAKGYQFYEAVCQDCGCKLSFGQHKEGGTLFPKRKDTDGSWLPNHGWGKYESSKDFD
jgi:bacterioferritin-associated ferredoxin